ncbi:DUF3024 domain-containing protein [Endozoicomonas sp.]|uniref:DUF3024 domain-containing protein n=1 Tax=Endozoicomonas sp. TaxID=1892382 RepID=UPI00383B355C
MAFSEIEIKRIEKAIDGFMAKRRPPAHIRNEVDFDHRINGQSIELFEVRAYYQDPEQKVEIPFAKVTYVKTQKLWKLFWHKSDMKWHSYEPLPTAKELEELLDAVDEDEYRYFFG